MNPIGCGLCLSCLTRRATPLAYPQLAWVSGFLTAFDYYGSGSGNVGGNTDENGLLAWIDNYCATHPLDNIAAATIALITELSQRAVSGQPAN